MGGSTLALTFGFLSLLEECLLIFIVEEKEDFC